MAKTYSLGNINHSSFCGGGGFASVLGDQSPELVQVDISLVESVRLLVVELLALLSVVSGMAKQGMVSEH